MKGCKLETHLRFLFPDVGNIDLKYARDWFLEITRHRVFRK